MNDLILYTTEDGRSQIKVRADQQTVWLTQQDTELDPAAVVKESLTTAADGMHYRRWPILYTLCRELPPQIGVRNREAP
jgi:hypothetical protein